MINPVVKRYGNEERWVNYRMIEREGKMTKIPYDVRGRKASSTDESDWSTYTEALKASKLVGIVFTPTRLLLGIDIDHCINKATGNIDHPEKEGIENLILAADTYTEISPSQEGLHLLLGLTMPLGLIANRSSPYECYTSGRYFTFTGNVYGSEKEVRVITPEQVIKLLSSIGYPWNKNKIKFSQNEAVSDEGVKPAESEILERMFSSKKGAFIKALYGGDTSKYKDDESAADIALCVHLAFWTAKDKNKMEEIWLASPLGSRNKTQKRKDYRDRTINRAVRLCKEVYKPKNQKTNLVVGTSFKARLEKERPYVYYEIAQALIEKHGVKTIGEAKKEIYVYKEGIYVPGETVLNTEIQLILEEQTTINCKKEIISKIKDLTVTERKDFNEMNRDLINLDNGVLNVRTKEIFPHDPKYLFFTKFPVSYKPEVDCPNIKKFISEILSHGDIAIIQEWMGYCLYRKYFIKKAMIFVGEPNTGKTTLLNVARKLIGNENVSGVSLQRISGDKFSAAHLYNKHINIFDDLSFKDVNDNGAFKIATGGGVMTGEYKFGNQFNFENYSKLTYSANKIPNVNDSDDEAYFGRWIVVQFNNPAKVKNNFLVEQITTPEELSGFLNFALEGLDRLLKNQDFSYGKTADDIKDEMLRSGSPVANFAYDCLVNEPQNWISKDDMYAAYANFVKEEKSQSLQTTCLIVNKVRKRGGEM